MDQDITSPMGLTVDLRAHILYWVDRDKGTIESVDYDGESRRTIRSGETSSHFFALTLFEVSTAQNMASQFYTQWGLLAKVGNDPWGSRISGCPILLL